MYKKIYVGNLPFSATEDDVRNLFAPHGEVRSVSMVTDRDTGRPRGFGFVEMEAAAAGKAIAALDQTDMNGRTLSISEAKPRRDDRGGGGGFGGGGRGRGGDRDRDRW
jgi:RNA recognition motif-containing protein